MEKRTSLIKLFTYQIWVLLCIIFISFISCNGGAGKKTESIVPPTAGLILIPDEPEKVGIDSDGNLISYNKVIIDFVDATQIDEINSIISSINGEITGYLPQIGVYEIRVQTTSATEIEALINSLSANPKVEFVEKNYTGKIIATDVETNPDGLLQTWGYESIKLPEAYRYLRSIGKYDDSTPDIVIAVIDNAIETEHPELKPNLLPNYYFYDVGDMDRDVRYTDIFRENFQAGVNGDKEFLNAKKHGTWVAGIAAGVNNGRLLNGVAYRAKIMPIKIFSSDPRFSEQVFFYFKLAGAILYATDLGADVINMSLGGSVLPGVLGIWQLNKAIDYAHSKGVVLIAGAGNDARDASFYYPATNSKVISVGGTDFFNERWVDSNYSSSNLQSVLSLAAPAKDIVGPDAENYYGAVIDSGTSASAPFVSGLAALLKALDPTLNSPQNPSQIEQIMRDTADNIPVDYDGDTVTDGTWKRINVYNAVLAVTAPTCTDIDTDGFSIEGGACGLVDCNDTKNTVYPNAPELCDSLDNQCPGNVGYGSIDEGCATECSDGIDNDGDGFIDFPNDPGCIDANDTSEYGTNECDDGIDNDGDTTIDLIDPDCTAVLDASESAYSCSLNGNPKRITNASGFSGYTNLIWTGTEFGLMWSDDRAQATNYFDIFLTTLDINGNKQIPETQITSTSSAQEWTYSGLAWNGFNYGASFNYTDFVKASEVRFTTISSSGTKLFTEKRVPDTQCPLCSDGSYLADIIWDGNKWIIAYLDNRNAPTVTNVFTSFFDNSGVKILPDKEILLNSADIPGPIITWDANKYLTLMGNTSKGISRSIMTPLTQSLVSNLVTDPPGIYRRMGGFDFIILPSYGYFLVWEGLNKKLYLAKLDIAGNLVGQVRQFTSPTIESLFPEVSFDGTNIGLVWEDKGNRFSANNSELFFALIDVNGFRLSADLSIPTGVFGTSSNNPSIASFGNGNFGIAWEEWAFNNWETAFQTISCIPIP